MEAFISAPLIKVVVICFTVLLLTIISIIAAKNKWFKGFEIGKHGIKMETAPSEDVINTEYQGGFLLNQMNGRIRSLDMELTNFAIEQSHYLRKTLTNKLSKHICCNGIRRAVSAVIRFPLYDASRRNDFKTQLKPENIMGFTERLLKEITTEYEEYSIIQDMSRCVMDATKKCPSLPEVHDISNTLSHEVLCNWAVPIREMTIEICGKKIKVYEEYLEAFDKIEDQVRRKIAEYCIEKNKGYIETLSRTPDTRLKEA